VSGAADRDEIQVNTERCHDSLAAARELLESGHYDAAASRAYYAAFHAATAVLGARGLKFSKHKGLIAAVHRDLVRPGALSVEVGKALDSLFRVRGVGDYGGLDRVTEEGARRAVANAEHFVEEALRLLKPE
jgi:uncharacterized protein (UPF0332 family)